MSHTVEPLPDPINAPLLKRLGVLCTSTVKRLLHEKNVSDISSFLALTRQEVVDVLGEDTRVWRDILMWKRRIRSQLKRQLKRQSSASKRREAHVQYDIASFPFLAQVDLFLSARTIRFLREKFIGTKEAVLAITNEDVFNHPTMGKAVWKEIQALQHLLRPPVDEEPQQIVQSVFPSESPLSPPSLESPVVLSARTRRFLRERNCVGEDEILELTWEDVRKHPTMGRKVWEEIQKLQRRFLGSHGASSLGPSPASCANARLTIPISQLVARLSVRTQRFLRERDVFSRDEVFKLTWEDVCGHPTMGKKVWEEVQMLQQWLRQGLPSAPTSPFDWEEPKSWLGLWERIATKAFERNLTDKDRALIGFRLGLTQQEPPETLERVAQRLGLSRERVRQCGQVLCRRLQSAFRNPQDRLWLTILRETLAKHRGLICVKTLIECLGERFVWLTNETFPMAFRFAHILDASIGITDVQGTSFIWWDLPRFHPVVWKEFWRQREGSIVEIRRWEKSLCDEEKNVLKCFSSFSPETLRIYGYSSRRDVKHIYKMRGIVSKQPYAKQRSRDDFIRSVYERAAKPLTENEALVLLKSSHPHEEITLGKVRSWIARHQDEVMLGETHGYVLSEKVECLSSALIEEIEASLQSHLEKTGLPSVLLHKTLRTFGHRLGQGMTQRALYGHLRREGKGKLAYACYPRVALKPENCRDTVFWEGCKDWFRQRVPTFLPRRAMMTVWTRIFGGELRMMDQEIGRILGLQKFCFHGVLCYGFSDRIAANTHSLPPGTFDCQLSARILQGTITVPIGEREAFAKNVGLMGSIQRIRVKLWEGRGDEGVVSMELIRESSYMCLHASAASLAAICLRRLYHQWAKRLSEGYALPTGILGTYLHVEPMGTGNVRVTCFGRRPSRALGLSSEQWEQLKAYAAVSPCMRNRGAKTPFPDVNEIF